MESTGFSFSDISHVKVGPIVHHKNIGPIDCECRSGPGVFGTSTILQVRRGVFDFMVWKAQDSVFAIYPT